MEVIISKERGPVTISWISNSDGFWDVGSNWSTGVAPTATDSVQISKPGVTVTIRTGGVQVSDLSVDSTLAVTGGFAGGYARGGYRRDV